MREGRSNDPGPEEGHSLAPARDLCSEVAMGRARASARSLRRRKQSSRYGSSTRRPDQQDPRGSGRPMACRSISRSRRVRRATNGCVRFSSAPCVHARCYSQIADTTPTLDQGACSTARSMGEHSAASYLVTGPGTNHVLCAVGTSPRESR
jgi:hypothetical protein